MFRSAATKIAHNSTLPALAGNKELRPLQDLITSEKVVMAALQNYSNDFAKAADALRAWGVGEGDDLGDTLSHCSTLLLAFSTALHTYANAHTPIRAAMKSIRTAEETLDELKRRRKALHAKADSAERKLTKMNPEHKGLPAQTDVLNKLREEIRGVESDIIEGESRLGDEKRRAVKTWMNVKWTGLGECCEKGLIAAEYGRTIIAEIPESVTPPGMPRVAYYGQQKTQALVAEAQRGIEGVNAFTGQRPPPRRTETLDSLASPIGNDGNLPPIPLVYNNEEQELHAAPQNRAPQYPSEYGSSFSAVPPPNQSPDSYKQDFNPYPMASPGHNGQSSFVSSAPQSQFSSYNQTIPQSAESSPYQPYGQPFSSAHPGLPQNEPPPPTHQEGTPYSSSFLPGPKLDFNLGSGHFIDSSDFSGLDPKDNSDAKSNVPPPSGPGMGRSVDDFGVTGPSSNFSQMSQPLGGRFATFPVKSRTGGGSSISETQPPSGAPDAPAYSAEDPSLSNPWDAERDLYGPAGRRTSKISDHSGGLAYDRDDSDSRGGHSNRHVRGPPGGHDEPSDSEGGKHVRFGEVSDVEEELEKRHQLQQQQQHHQEGAEAHVSPSSPHTPMPFTPTTPTPATHGTNQESSAPPSHDQPPSVVQQHAQETRDPPRAHSPPLDPQEEERQRNAAAAREISREMDSLTFAPSAGPPLPQYEVAQGRDRAGSASRGEMSPLAPPVAPFAARSRSVSPLPNVDVNVPAQAARASPATSSPRSPSFARERDRVSPTATQQQGPPSPVAPAPQPAYGGAPPMLTVRGESDADISMRSVSPMSTAYRTPPEYYSPRLGARTASGSISGGGPGGQGPSPRPSPVPGTKTISAAAFRRPPPRMASGDGSPIGGGIGGHTMPNLTDTPPLSLKKRLPSSPHPPVQGGLPAPGSGGMRAVSGPGSLQNAPPHGSEQGAPGPGAYGEEDGFDYINAYVNSPGDGGNTQTEFAPMSRQDPSSGYGGGRFTTDLEREGLR
ncbi:hypothetical protein HGRIS_014314 [Hohenbuehelia grisea]|uniref:Eisosome component PIL1-domain-containing protein n=1 Tax=Hohenbuehelia grisea TaxID=104357 RepID=A0ABR3JTV0_9AGAR